MLDTVFPYSKTRAFEQPGCQRANHHHIPQTTPKRSTKHHESTVYNFPPLCLCILLPKPRVSPEAHGFPGPIHLLMTRQQQCDPRASLNFFSTRVIRGSPPTSGSSPVCRMRRCLFARSPPTTPIRRTAAALPSMKRARSCAGDLKVPADLFHRLEINNARAGVSRYGWKNARDRLNEMKVCPRAPAEVRELTGKRMGSYRNGVADPERYLGHPHR